jgi:hypothetical protein
MARKVLTEIGYEFTPATKTLVIPKYIMQEKLILITNVTTNQVIYNFSDPSLRATSYTSVVNADSSETTTVIFNYNTLAMNVTDKLQITFEEQDETFMPSQAYTDPTNKLRVTTPQALIDTDFEYGIQGTKWENLTTTDNRPFASQSSNSVPNITGIGISGRTVTVTTSAAHNLAVADPIIVQDTFLGFANGNFIIETITTSAPFTFTYSARASNTTGISALFDSNKTVVYKGNLYTGAQIGAAPTAMAYVGSQITVTTTVPHGLSIGNEIAVTGTTASTNAPNGSFYVAGVDSATKFVYYASAVPTGTLVSSSAKIYVRPQGQILHRPFDGGVIFSANTTSNNEMTARQTRRYFRYQSGKGIQLSSGTILKPNLQIDSLTSNGTTITVQTREQHNLTPGVAIAVGGAADTAYNGNFVVANVLGYNKFTYTALTAPTSAVGAGPYYVSIVGWNGAINRLGIFDLQNGLFFEYDGQTLYAVRRSSTFQLSGKVTATNGSNTITQTGADFPTNFSNQLVVGDFIVIRGQSYQVQTIASNTSLTITPSYRGATASYAIVSKTVDTKIPQSQWNLDPADGTGPSGYNIDLSKMQMFYIDYSWYGAGFVRWGIRGSDGDVMYVHKQPNNNINYEAYMRSGNLPGRYETSTTPPITLLQDSLTDSDSIITVQSTAAFPSSGTLVIRPSSATNQADQLFEYVNYTGKTTTEFTGVTRGLAGASITTTGVTGSNGVSVTDATGLQVGQRAIHANIPGGTFISSINGLNLTLSQALTGDISAASVTYARMGGVNTAPDPDTYKFSYTYSATSQTSVELAFPTFAPNLSHWGTSVIMDGRFDDDKSLLFTYGQRTTTAIGAGATKALFSIRVAPSVDNGVAAEFGARELINRMQLVLRALDITTRAATSNLLVTAVLNGVPNLGGGSQTWKNVIQGSATEFNSSLSQIADYAGGSATVAGGEVTGGFFVNSTTSLSLESVRDLGNAILGGGTSSPTANIYPDGPDVLTISVTNLGASSQDVFGRLSWTEAQA